MLARRLPISAIAVACAALLALGASGCAARAADARLAGASALDKRVIQSAALLDRLVDPGAPGCSAAVGHRGEVLWADAAGLADRESGVALTPETRLDLASLSKQFTATAILLLRRDGLLSLADPIATHVADLPAWGETVTLDQLLHHTGRVREYWPVLEADGLTLADPVGQAEIVRAIARQRDLEPGEGYLYSNSGYVLLAEVVQRVSGLTLPEFLAERVFRPLDLGLELPVGPASAGETVSYDAQGARVEIGWHPLGPSGILGTPSELVRWADQYRTGPLVGVDFADGAVDNGEGGRYGAGISVQADGSLRHDGRIGGFISTFQVSADRELAIVVMCNGHAADRFGIADGLRAVWGFQ